MSSQDAEAIAALKTEGPQRLIFHPDHNQRKPGSVILRAGDKLSECFYANLPLLAALSSFFADLPSPSEADLVDGVPFIPLHDTTSIGISICLHAIDSLCSPNPLDLKSVLQLKPECLLEAAIAAKMYDLPIVHRLLAEGLGPHSDDHLILFAIGAIAGADEIIVRLGGATIGVDLTSAPKCIINPIILHAPAYFIKLQDLHLRHAIAPSRFHALPAMAGSWDPCTGCSFDAYGRRELQSVAGVTAAYKATRTVEDIIAVEKADFGMVCSTCIGRAREFYKERLGWFTRFANEYGFVEEQ